MEALPAQRRYAYLPEWYGAMLVVLCAVFFAPVVKGQDAFVVTDIRVEGLQRISAGTVFNYLPISVGDEVDSVRTAEAIRALYKTGFFKDVRLDRIGGVLLVMVQERPAIAKIDISGNESIESEPLLAALKDIGLAEGRVFNRSLLDQLEQELRRQYFGQGRYGVKLEAEVTPLERNRVGVSIEISEGLVARIKQISIIGNENFSDKELLKTFKLSTPTLFSFYTRNDQYSKQKLAADLESLRSWYLDRGFVNFQLDSTQVSITPDKKDIYITINITEGDVFFVDEIKLAGDLVVPKEDLFKLIQVYQGDVFSRKETTATATAIENHLGTVGYAFANVNTIPEVKQETGTVSVTFFVDPAKRVYVRRVNITGNTKTRAEVLRRELRQMENAWISTKSVERSKARMRRLGYFQDVNVETPAVPGTTDQVDVNFSVTEKASGNILAGLGFSQSQGLILNASISQDNFLGSGKRVSFTFNNSSANTVYNLGYTNPYYTLDGISRGFQLTYRKTDADEIDISRYTTDVLSGSVNYGIPINEFDRVRVFFEYENTELKTGSFPSQEIVDFIADNGDKFDTLKVGVSWSHDSRNRAVFADRGILHRLSAEVALPGGSLEYFKISTRQLVYLRLTNSLTLSLNGDVGYGDSYGDTTELPVFENFFAGGVKSVRGYQDFSLGPRDSQGDPLGGNLKLVGNIDLIFPTPFASEKKSVQLSAFIDGGNVYGDKDDFSFDSVRYSTGLSTIWLSPVGPLKFVLAYPLNDKEEDDTQIFQFSLGSAF